jgi:integrase
MRTRRGKGDGNVSQRRDGRWSAYVTVPGKGRRYVYGPTRHEAIAELRILQRRLAQGKVVGSSRLRLGAFLDSWLIAVEPNLRPQSWRRYQQLMVDHVQPTLGGRQLIRLEAEELQQLYAVKVRAGLSPATVRMIHFVLHRALRDAVRWGRSGHNPADLVDPPRLPRKEASVLSLDEVRAVLEASAGHQFELLFRVALTTGLRRGELLALRWRDIDFGLGSIAVRGTLQPSSKGSAAYVAEPKSSSSRRDLAIDSDLVQRLWLHQTAWPTTWDGDGSAASPEDFVFVSSTGRPISPSSLLRSWGRLLRRVGLQHAPFHATRHTAATLMLGAGVSPRVAAERLGHATVAMTLDRYSHVSDSLRRDAARAVRGLLEGPDGTDRVSNRVSNGPPNASKATDLISETFTPGRRGREGRIRTADLTVPNRAL